MTQFIYLLGWLGLAMIVAGGTAGLVSGQWLSLPLGLMMTGAVLVSVLWLWRWRRTHQGRQSWWQRRATQSGTNALIATVAVLVILSLINFMAVRYLFRADFTEQKTYSLAPQTLNVLSTLQQPVEVLVFIGNDASASETQSQIVLQNQLLLKEYQRQQPNLFKFRFVDPQAEPGLARKHNIRNLGDISLVYGQRQKVLSAGLSEVTLTPAIALMTNSRQATAYVIQGHNEVPLSGVAESLASGISQLKLEGIKVNPLNLSLKQQIPEDANVLVVAGPKLPLLDNELTLIDMFVQQGGNLLLMLDPEVDVGLNPLLKSMGVTLDGRLIVDPKHARLAWPAAVTYGEHPITRSFSQKISFFPFAQAIDVQEQPGQQVSKLLQTSEEAWAETDLTGQQIQFDAERDRKGPLAIGVAIERSISAPQAAPAKDDAPASSKPPSTTSPSTPPSPSPASGTQPSPVGPSPSAPISTEAVPPPSSPGAGQSEITGEASRVVIIGDSDFAKDDPYFEQTVNRDIFVNAVSWLLADSDDPTLSIRPKTVIQRSLKIPEQRRMLLNLLGVVLLPLAAFAMAAALWWQRR